MRLLRLFTVLLACLASVTAWAYPQPVGRVNDFAHLLSAAQAKALASEITDFEAKTQHQLAVVTVSSLEGRSVEDYTIGLAREWGVGRQGANDGVVLLVAPNERKVRIEVGKGLEHELSDFRANRIIQNTLLPLFKAGQMAEGALKGAREIMTTLNPPPPPPPPTPEEIQARAAARQAQLLAQDEAIKARAVEDAASQAALLRGLGYAGSGLAFLGLIVGIVRYSRASLACKEEFAEMADQCDRLLKTLSDELGRCPELLSELPSFCSARVVDALTDRHREVGKRVSPLRKRLTDLRLTYNPWSIGTREGADTVEEIEAELKSACAAIMDVRRAHETGEASRTEAVRMRTELPGRLSTAGAYQKDARVSVATKAALQEAGEGAARLPDFPPDGDWGAFRESLRGVHRELSHGVALAENDIQLFERAPAEAARLLKELPDLLKTLEKTTAKSEAAQKALDEAKRNMGQAVAQHRSCSDSGGISGMDWLIIYMLLSDSSASANTAVQTVQHETRAAEDAARASAYRSSDSSSSSSDCGSSSFGGGDFGGGGASGSW